MLRISVVKVESEPWLFIDILERAGKRAEKAEGAQSKGQGTWGRHGFKSLLIVNLVGIHGDHPIFS